MGFVDPRPGPSPVRPVAAIDVAGVAEALEDGDRDTTWWYDPATGQVEMGVSPWIADDFGEDDDPSERGLMPIESEGSRAAYTDMVDFADSVGEARAADLLRRALHGRGAFGRFRETLYDFPDLQPRWTTYSRACAVTRATEWLAAEGYVDGDDADAALAIRAATLVNVGAAIGRQHGLDIEVEAIGERWRDIERAIEAGHDVTLRRDGRAWATISPV